jgi:predicted nucleotidyltransferase component of viral defense system
VNRYADAPALRQAIETRLKQTSEDTQTDLGRLRRIVVFDRLLSRLAAASGGQWVLKGGAALEFRLPHRARTTKDLDLATRAQDDDGDILREELIEALSADRDHDLFTFRLGSAKEMTPDATGRRAWRYTVESWLAGRLFAAIRLDVAARSEELLMTQAVTLPGVLAFAGIPARSIETVSSEQHFAEKLHALTRDYGERPNTRIKDLIDLVLLIDSGLRPDRVLLTAVRHVFAVRATHPLPAVLPEPPPNWRQGYPTLAAELTVSASELSEAADLVRSFWAKTLTAEGNPEEGPRRSVTRP